MTNKKPAPFSIELCREETAQWIAEMAQHEGFLKYAQERCKELEKDESGLFVGLRHRVKEIMDARKSNEESASGTH